MPERGGRPTDFRAATGGQAGPALATRFSAAILHIFRASQRKKCKFELSARKKGPLDKFQTPDQADIDRKLAASGKERTLGVQV